MNWCNLHCFHSYDWMKWIRIKSILLIWIWTLLKKWKSTFSILFHCNCNLLLRWFFNAFSLILWFIDLYINRLLKYQRIWLAKNRTRLSTKMLFMETTMNGAPVVCYSIFTCSYVNFHLLFFFFLLFFCFFCFFWVELRRHWCAPLSLLCHTLTLTHTHTHTHTLFN